MTQIGKINTLKIKRLSDKGAFLYGKEVDNLFLPSKQCPTHSQVEDSVKVFLYLDKDGYLAATTNFPIAFVNQCAYLKVVELCDAGALLDWGFKDYLLIPHREQHTPYKLGNKYVVTILFNEEKERFFGSSKLKNHLSETSVYFKPRQEVSLLICGNSPMGFKAIVNHTHLGLIFRDDAFKPLRYGEQCQGFIKGIREDGKIDLTIQLASEFGKTDLSNQILSYLKQHGGRSSLTDKSDPKKIYAAFNVSKNNYKKALGALYKQRLISIDDDEIQLIDKHEI